MLLKKQLSILLFALILFDCKLSYAMDIQQFDIDASAINSAISGNLPINFDFETLIDMVLKGDIEDIIDYVFSAIKSDFANTLGDHKKIMSTLLPLVFLSSCQNLLFQDDFMFVSRLVNISAAGFLCATYIVLYTLASNTIGGILNFLKSALPVFLGFSAAISIKSTYLNTVFIFSLTVFQWLCENILLPGITFAAVLSIVDSFNDSLNFANIKSSIISAVNWTIGIYSTLFIGALKIVQITVFSSDRLLYGGIRYTISRGIPVVGSYVSESLGAVLSGVITLYNSVGIAVVIIILLIVLVPVVSIFLVSWLLKFISGFAGTFAHQSCTNLIGDIGLCISELGIVLLVCSVGFIVAFSLMLTH